MVMMKEPVDSDLKKTAEMGVRWGEWSTYDSLEIRFVLPVEVQRSLKLEKNVLEGSGCIDADFPRHPMRVAQPL